MHEVNIPGEKRNAIKGKGSSWCHPEEAHDWVRGFYHLIEAGSVISECTILSTGHSNGTEPHSLAATRSVCSTSKNHKNKVKKKRKNTAAASRNQFELPGEQQACVDLTVLVAVSSNIFSWTASDAAPAAENWPPSSHVSQSRHLASFFYPLQR